MNRNMFKLIAVVSMLIDHIGYFYFDNNIWMRLIGRLAFPIFAFFIAEGMKHTKSRKKYILTLFIFALITQIPYGFLFGFEKMNVLFTFLIAVLLIELIDNYKILQIVGVALITLTSVLTLILGLIFIIDYGFCGVGLILILYYVKKDWLKYLLGILTILLFSLHQILMHGPTIFSLICVAGIVSILLLALTYNGQKGKVNLKYFFYIFYPMHFIVILIINLLM